MSAIWSCVWYGLFVANMGHGAVLMARLMGGGA